MAENPDRFARVVAANTFLPTGDTPPGKAFLRLAGVLADRRRLRGRVHRQYGLRDEARRRRSPPRTTRRSPTIRTRPAPASSRCSSRRVPTIRPPTRIAGRWETLKAWDKPFLTAFSDQDPITQGGDRVFQRDVPGCAGQPHTTIDGGGHFLQEDRGPALAKVIEQLDSSTGSVERSTSTRCSTNCAPSRRPVSTTAENPFDRERYDRLLDIASQEYADAFRRAERARDPRPIRRRDRLRDRAGRRRRRRVRRARPRPPRAARRRRQMGAGRGLGRSERTPGNRPRSANWKRKPDCEAASTDSSVSSSARPDADEHPHGTVSIVYLCSILGGELRAQPHEVRELAWRAIDDVEPGTWHHHHEHLARAALDALWRAAGGPLELSRMPIPNFERTVDRRRALLRRRRDRRHHCGPDGPGGHRRRARARTRYHRTRRGAQRDRSRRHRVRRGRHVHVVRRDRHAPTAVTAQLEAVCHGAHQSRRRRPPGSRRHRRPHSDRSADDAPGTRRTALRMGSVRGRGPPATVSLRAGRRPRGRVVGRILHPRQHRRLVDRSARRRRRACRSRPARGRPSPSPASRSARCRRTARRVGSETCSATSSSSRWSFRPSDAQTVALRAFVAEVAERLADTPLLDADSGVVADPWGDTVHIYGAIEVGPRGDEAIEAILGSIDDFIDVGPDPDEMIAALSELRAWASDPASVGTLGVTLARDELHRGRAPDARRAARRPAHGHPGGGLRGVLGDARRRSSSSSPTVSTSFIPRSRPSTPTGPTRSPAPRTDAMRCRARRVPTPSSSSATKA